MRDRMDLLRSMRAIWQVYAVLLILLAFLSACRPPIPPKPPEPPTPETFTAHATVTDEFRQQIPELLALLDIDAEPPITVRCGYIPTDVRIACVAPLETFGWQAHLHLRAPGYYNIDGMIAHLTPELGDVVMAPVPVHVDPSLIPLETLAKIKGAMWTQRINIPYGPRPNQDTNINAFVFYDLYDAETRTRMRETYKAAGYTHTVAGPVTGNDCYHNLYPCRRGIPTQEQWDAYLDSIQELWDNGLTPCYFAKPDGWEVPERAADMDRLDALYRQERAQKLLRCVIYPGWEPSGTKYGWNNEMYVRWVKRGADVFPHALRGVHFVSDLDAPTGLNDDEVFPPGQGNGISWRNVAPYIHFWADQHGGYVEEGTPVPSGFFLDELAKHIKRVKAGFHNGFAGWPTFSAWGPGKPIKHISAEYAAYLDFWRDYPEVYAKQIGDAAMDAGADGYLDGGTREVR